MTIPIPEIRQYLTSAYSDDELGTLCSDYFRDVYENFAAGMTKAQKIGLLLDYCQRRDQLPNLLAALKRDRPQQYPVHFAGDIVEVRPAASQPSPASVPQPPPRPQTAWRPARLWLVMGGAVGLVALVVAVLITRGGGKLALIPAPTLGIGSAMISEQDGMTLFYVPAGEFLMGSADDDLDAGSDEKPQRKVTLDAYWIDRTEVTKDQYQRCVVAGKCAAPGDVGTGQGDQPVVYVNWQDAANYCAWAGRRLPTEAEWEKAARGTDGRIYPWGNEAPSCNRLNYRGKDGECVGDISAVGSYQSGVSPYGALDMAGNVREWAADWADKKYYASSPAQNPKGPASGQYRIVRGGSWNDDQGLVRAAFRRGDVPGDRNVSVGFRCARSIGTGAPIAPATATSELSAVLPTMTASEPTNTGVVPSATPPASRSETPTAALEPPSAPPTPVPTRTPTPTPRSTAAGTPSPTLGIGSRTVSEQDGMTLVYVPAGEFLMGSADDDPDADSDEKPQHKVYLDAYWIDRTEVTKDQYQRCVAAGKCGVPSCSGTGQGDHPAVCVTWQDATNYCAWAGRRLPTEAEWEKAARGTDERKYPWGNEAPDCGRLNYWGKDGGCVGNTSAVESYPSGAGPYDALDMAGNVWEWVADWYGEKYYASSPAQNPQGPTSGQYRVLRGGSWDDIQGLGRAAFRNRSGPDGKSGSVGFRCARS